MTKTRWAALALATALIAAPGVLASGVMSCAATPTVPPLRSFESAKDIDVVCLQVFTTSAGVDGGMAGLPLIPPIPKEQQLCAPVPVNQIGSILPYHLFALVTQTARGEVAVVDLTAGMIIDEDPATPGINFLPVGANPAGIAAAPNGAMTFVTSADPTKPAIYGLASVRILGAGTSSDSGVVTVYGGADAQAPTLPSWPACSLPAIPGPIVAIPQAPQPEGQGEGDAGPESQGYVLAVVLPGDGVTQGARVVTIDPRPLLRGGGVDIGPGPTVEPGSLEHCPILGETPLSGHYTLPSGTGPAWDNGVRYVIEGGPSLVNAAGGTDDAGYVQATALGYVGPTPVPLPSFVCVDSGTVSSIDAGASPPSLGPALPQATAAARAGNYLYIGDESLPIIHVIDITNPLAPKEIEPLVATSANQPTRSVIVSGLAVSPVTRDYVRYLYALDQQDNPASIIVYDITDPVHSPHVPLTRPHPELNPVLPPDRIQFTAPVAAVAFASHDFPLTDNPSSGGAIVGAAASGLLCNPNPSVDLSVEVASDGEVVDSSFLDAGQGAFYRNNFTVQQVGLGPARLRGIFGFATLTNGDVMLIDIDDWDSPCRRPASMSANAPFTSNIAPPEFANPSGESLSNPLIPYQAPDVDATNGISWVTNETFFPVSQPHRPRSLYAFNDDPVLGIHYPQLTTTPQLSNFVGSVLPAGADAGNPTLLPAIAFAGALPSSGTLANPVATPEGGVNNTVGVGVLLAWEDPLVYQNQTWAITYEGVLPTFSGIPGYIDTNPSDPKTADGKLTYQTLRIDLPSAHFCSRGVEDLAIGRERVAAAEAAASSVGAQFPPVMNDWVGDYIQITDSLPLDTDPYWSLPEDCWPDDLTDATARYQQCYNYFNPTLTGTTTSLGQSPTRDFPIIEAYDDHLVVTSFNYPCDLGPSDAGMTTCDTYPVPQSTTNRQVTPPSSSNAPFLKALQCCFHAQAGFSIRAGGEWVASVVSAPTGTAAPFYHHVTTDASNRCVLSCDPQQSLLNARSVGFFSASPAVGAGGAVDRNSPLAMRNPMFSYYVEHPVGPDPSLSPTDPRSPTVCAAANPGSFCTVQRVQRDLAWTFTTSGAFTNQLVNLSSTGTQVSPQSMLFIPSLGQLAVVDGAQEGLVLIDLGTVAVSGSPYF